MNNREIKFRAWDKTRNELVYFDDLYWFEENYVNYIPNTRYVFHQFTGLKTKSGKEIYEGDVVAEKMTEEMAADGESCNVGRVFFAAGTFMIDGDGPLYERTHSLTPDILEDYEVIGNIFENPELLEK